ncbi:MAG: Beta-galactosidase C-terminal domain, partial [Bacteroidales bacterium]|nr:Beta-galactosidase C-terminal domain [Bacteroidales bacterium]
FCCGKTYDLCYCQSPSFDRSRLFAWLRSDGKKTFLIVSNFSDREVIAEILIPKDASSYLGASLPSSVSVSVPPEDYTLIQI